MSKHMDHIYEVVDSLELYAVTELEIVVYKLPSGEGVFVFEDCRGGSPVVYDFCLEEAAKWAKERKRKN